MKKKFIKLGLLLTIVVGIILGIKTVSAATTSLTKSESGWYWQRYIDGTLYSWKLRFYDFNGRVAYCIEPGVTEGEEYTTTTLDVTTLSNDVKEELLLIAYYGYEYTGHQTKAYRAATQALIWELLGNSRATFSSERWASGTIYDVSDEMEEIEKLVKNHYVRPSFNGKTVEGKVGEKITLTDTNKVLSNYEVYASNGAEVSISGNTLTITPTKIGEIQITLKKKTYINVEYLVYYSAGYQTLLSSGSVDPVVSAVTVESDGGDVEFNKYDKDNNSNTASGEATLEGAVYGVYDKDTDELIDTATTDENGYAKISNLPYFGDFYLQEISASTGYELDTTKYYFTSSISNVDNSIIVKEKVINRDVEMTKVYATSESTIMTIEENVEFGFYDKDGNLYTSGVTDSNGKLKVNLVYGTYTVKQLTTSQDTTKVNDFTITISESGDTIYYTISNAEITARLKVIKIDAETGNVIKRSGIKFKIYDVENEEYVCQTITYPSRETICEYETDEDGILITPYPLDSGTYYLEEVDQVIDGYLWNDKSVEFTIGDDSELSYDDEYGILFEVKFENKAVKGNVEITKFGEEVELTDDGYVYTSIKLSGVKIGLYASDDIYDGVGNLIYEKGTLIDEYETDEDGNIKIENLYLGSYYIQEIETVNGHVLDTTKHQFTLEYVDQYTETVTYQTAIVNHLPKGKLEFTKTDFSTSEPLPNTKIEIYTEDDELIFSGYTNENGKIIIDELPIGKYYILEKEAPDGYELNNEKMYFEITEDGEVVKCVMKDNQIVEVPDTDLTEGNQHIIIAIAIGMAGLGIIVYGFIKNKKRK